VFANLIDKLIKFCIVGGAGMIIDFAVTYVLKEKIKIQRYVASSIGFACAVSLNYYLNRVWTFESSNPVTQEYALFVIFSMVGLVINVFFINVFERLGTNFYFAKFFAIVITASWNFFSNYLYNF
jgi:putative flippase GtrA